MAKHALKKKEENLKKLKEQREKLKVKEKFQIPGGIIKGKIFRKDKNGNWINNAIDVEVWGRSGEVIKEKMGQGDSFYGIGKVVMNEWESDGGKRRKHIFKCNRFEFLPRISDTSTGEVPF